MRKETSRPTLRPLDLHWLICFIGINKWDHRTAIPAGGSLEFNLTHAYLQASPWTCCLRRDGLLGMCVPVALCIPLDLLAIAAVLQILQVKSKGPRIISCDSNQQVNPGQPHFFWAIITIHQPGTRNPQPKKPSITWSQPKSPLVRSHVSLRARMRTRAARAARAEGPRGNPPGSAWRRP